jgi:hypothetical protein
MYGKTEEELSKNAKEHSFKEHDHTEETWNDELSYNLEHFRSLKEFVEHSRQGRGNL